MTELASGDLACTAFEAAAPIYDEFTAHHDYELWMGAIEPLARRHGLRPSGTLLDIGCGTGKSFLPWLARGWAVTACDNSRAMLARAGAKVGDRVRLICADARELPKLGSFDFVTLIDDVANYLTPDELRLAFRGVASNLAAHGVFVFDLSTRHLFATFFASTEVRADADRLLVWEGRASPNFGDGDVADAYLDAVTRGGDGTWIRRRALHRQYHHPVEAVREYLCDAGLRLQGVYGQDYECNFEPAVDESRHTKCILVARHSRVPQDRERR
ncbi:MAG TPA: methyltransferase domain-containing protein [Solirubrobacteraceae bacterium]|nr:methyltransferase domain-containing protein [Solirubrobacteraceae bacterium]